MLAAPLDASELALTGLASLNVAPGVIHAAHGRWGAAGLSAAVRTACTVLLVVGAWEAFSAIGSHDGESSGNAATALALGGLLGYGTMIAVDASTAFDESVTSGREEAGLRLLPFVARNASAAGIQIRLKM